MQTAQLIKKLGLRPKRTIRVIAWMDEENGGGGHAAYTQAHASEFPNHVASFESDSGIGHALGLRAKVSIAALPWLKPAQDILASFGANLVEQTNESPETDIEPMAKAGVPAFGVLVDSRHYFDYHHSAADTLDKIDPQDLREDAAVMAVMAYALASLPQPLPR